MTALLPNGEQVFLDANGNPLASGTVDFYIPDTTTLKNTWQDSRQVTLNTNPVVLNASGRAVIFGEGSYRQVLKDSLGTTIWDKVVEAPAATTGTVTDSVAAALYGGP